MKFQNILFFILLIGLSTFIFAANLNVNSLTKEEVLPLVNGVTIKVHPEIYDKNKFMHKTVEIYFAKDGTLKGKTIGQPIPGQPLQDEGSWTVKNDGAVCLDWKIWGDFCLYFYPLKNNYLLVTGNQHGMALLTKAEIFKGNVEDKTGSTPQY